jgi:hypothetical protein
MPIRWTLEDIEVFDNESLIQELKENPFKNAVQQLVDGRLGALNCEKIEKINGENRYTIRASKDKRIVITFPRKKDGGGLTVRILATIDNHDLGLLVGLEECFPISYHPKR